MRGLIGALFFTSIFSPSNGHAHGPWAHIHVTGWAIENLAPGPVRDFFLSDPAIVNAALFGSAFTDSGYAPLPGDPIRDAARAYGEHTHWEPFVQDFIEWIIANDPPPWNTLESKMRVAFLMGCASHGLQDEIFDSLFLYQVEEHDQGDQDDADSATDGFLAIDGYIRFLPTPWIPIDTLLELYSNLEAEVTAETIQKSVDLMFNAYVNDTIGRAIIESNGMTYVEELNWTKAYYLDVSIPGSLRSEIIPTGRYLEAIWKRLHGQFENNDAVTFVFPNSPTRLLSGATNSPDSWITFIYGIGVSDTTAQTTFSKQSATGGIEHVLHGTQWGQLYTRLHRIKPLESLAPGGYYTVTLQPNAELINGKLTTMPIPHEFQVECDSPNTRICPPIDVSAPTLDGWNDTEPPAPIDEAAEKESRAEDYDSPSDDRDRLATNTKTIVGDGGCSLTTHASEETLYLILIVSLFLIRRRRITSLPMSGMYERMTLPSGR